jgi:ketosteroid isomerase-like protein
MTLVVERLRDAQNSDDAQQLAALFRADYQSSQPAHPNRGFGGSEQVFSNWSTLFDGIPDFTAELLASSVNSDTEWSEWDWLGTYRDGSRFSMRGVIIATIRDGLIAAARLYMEPTEFGGSDIDTTVQELSMPRTDGMR